MLSLTAPERWKRHRHKVRLAPRSLLQVTRDGAAQLPQAVGSTPTTEPPRDRFYGPSQHPGKATAEPYRLELDDDAAFGLEIRRQRDRTPQIAAARPGPAGGARSAGLRARPA